MKTQPTEWEKIFANNATNKGLISKIYKQFTQVNKSNNNKKKTLKLYSKKGRRPKPQKKKY